MSGRRWRGVAVRRGLIINNLMKKWRNLRDTYKRQLLVEKRNREGHNIKRKEYVYFKHMAFLRPHLDDEEPQRRPPLTTRRRRPLGHGSAARPAHPAHPAHPAPPLEHADIDEDKHFLLSLLPSFRRMSHDEKLSAKMDILRVIKEVRRGAAAALDRLERLDSLHALPLGALGAGEALVLGDARASYADTHVVTHGLVVKNELINVDVADYKSLSESGSLRSTSETECE
ncbi:uncharacterized protein LOC142982247 isoform X2 [Anticarsia gemmatalis]|uniref:uncharacterized protein LOC142982247 isoform X2 n=1 Tax=Anticarsia gemmatalis TaxID=129554 RepID=UPI003F76CF31